MTMQVLSRISMAFAWLLIIVFLGNMAYAKFIDKSFVEDSASLGLPTAYVVGITFFIILSFLLDRKPIVIQKTLLDNGEISFDSIANVQRTTDLEGRVTEVERRLDNQETTIKIMKDIWSDNEEIRVNPNELSELKKELKVNSFNKVNLTRLKVNSSDLDFNSSLTCLENDELTRIYVKEEAPKRGKKEAKTMQIL